MILAAASLLWPLLWPLLVPPPFQEAEAETVRRVPESWLVLESVDGRGRRPFRPDAVFAKHLLVPGSAPPEEGETVSGERGEATWKRVTPEDDGRVPERAGWAFATLDVAEAGVYRAKLTGAFALFVNGEGFVGDGYSYGYEGVPVALRGGTNQLFVNGIRGRFSLSFSPVEEAVLFHTRGARVDAEGLDAGDAVSVRMPVLHASEDDVDSSGASTGEGELLWTTGALRPLALGRLTARRELEEPVEPGSELVVELSFADAVRQDVHAFIERHLFTSDIDGSAQEYAVLPPTADDPRTVRNVALSLHGASVPLMNQARAYSQKEDFWIVVPTNRSPFGFDWQDQGREDLYEVLEGFLAQERFDGEPRVFVTGHSMGGHGTWHVGANDPDRFLALAPSAGWRSFDSYGGRPEGELTELWHGADLASRTELLVENLAQLPTFVVHGAEDDNVPVSEAEAMIALLEEHGATPGSHFQEGAGHWWDGDAAAGADCVDWPEIWELFRSAPDPEPVPSGIVWTSASPAVDADHHWLHVDQAVTDGEPLRFRGTWDAEAAEVTLETENVRRFSIRGLRPARVEVDGFDFNVAPLLEREEADFGRDLQLLLVKDKWRVELDTGWRDVEKTSMSRGPFKRAFRRNFVLVFGTAGDEAMDAELLARARFDQQTWWYRSNGVARLMSDADWLSAAAEEGFERSNVILYGNEVTNAAWRSLVPADAPVRIDATSITAGGERHVGDDLACVLVLPQEDAHDFLVGAFGSTGLTGARLGYVLAPFVSGVGYPDYAIFDSGILAEGDGGVLDAGWFDAYWKIPPPPPEYGDGPPPGDDDE